MDFFILTWDNLKNSFRTKKAIIFLALYLIVFGLITYAFFQVQAHIDDQIKQQGISQIQQDFMMSFARSIIQNNTDNNAVINFLFEVPPINIVLFFVSLIGTPLLLFILNYDKVSQEIYDGTIRYVLFRTTRFKIFFAKFLSSMIECSAITFVALFLGVLWASMKFQSVDFYVIIQYGIRYWAIAQFFLASFVAFSLMASSIFKKPFISLIVCFVAYGAMPILAFFVSYISPYDKAYFPGLFLNNSPALWFSLLVYLIYTAIFLTTGYQLFKRTDL